MDESNNTNQSDSGAQVSDSSEQSQDNDQGRLDQVKSKALKELFTLLPDTDSVNAAKRFDLYINDIHENGTISSAESALDAALAIEDRNARADALAELIDEVGYYKLTRG